MGGLETPNGDASRSWRIGMAAALSSWWYVRNLMVTGSLSGVLQDAALRRLALSARLRHAGDVNWLSALGSTFFFRTSGSGVGAFSSYARGSITFSPFYRVLAILGLALAWVRDPGSQGAYPCWRVCTYFSVWVFAYHILMTFPGERDFKLSGMVPLCGGSRRRRVLAAAGLRGLAPGRIRPYIVGALAGSFALLDLYGMLFRGGYRTTPGYWVTNRTVFSKPSTGLRSFKPVRPK